MFKTIRGRLITIILMMGIAGGFLYDHYRTSCGEDAPDDCVKRPLKLGLDLQGGMHLQIAIADPDGTMSAETKADMIDRVDQVIRTRIDEFGVEEPIIQQVGDDRLIVELAGITDADRAKSVVTRSAFLEFKLVLSGTDGLTEDDLSRIDRRVYRTLGADSIAALGRDVEGGDRNDVLLRSLTGGGDTTAVADTAQERVDSAQAAADSAQAAEDAARPFSSLLYQGDIPGQYLVAAEDADVARYLLSLPEVQAALPRDVSLQWGGDPVQRGVRSYEELYALRADPFLTGEQLEDARAERDPQFNQSIVRFQLSRVGGRRFSEFSGANIGNYLAIVLDGQVMSAPVIKDRIGATGQIEMGQGTPLEEARELALVLRAGALPAPIDIVEERTVGPSLGADSIAQGETAGIVGIVLVIGIMLLYYRMAGLLAVLALGFYVILVLGGLAAFDATLTVPGIAGIILSVGMAVDANVLIFERIREELVAGRATRTAVDEGFQHALSAIVDSNITTLFTALILFNFGTGPVRGFAVTLSIGIIASFVSALYVTRTFFLIYLSGKKASDPISI